MPVAASDSNPVARNRPAHKLRSPTAECLEMCGGAASLDNCQRRHIKATAVDQNPPPTQDAPKTTRVKPLTSMFLVALTTLPCHRTGCMNRPVCVPAVL